MFMYYRALAVGFVLWAVGTVLIRLAGQRILAPADGRATVLLLAGSMLAVAWTIRRLLGTGQSPERRASTVLAILIPTLVLDAFAAAFFPAVYPNIAPGAAGVFSAWMMACCAGAAIGATLGAPRS